MKCFSTYAGWCALNAILLTATHRWVLAQESPQPSPAARVDAALGDASLVITTESQAFEQGQPIVLDVLLKNTGKQNFSYGDWEVDRDIKLELTSSRGESASLTRYGEFLQSPRKEVFGSKEKVLKAGETKRYKILLNRIHDVTVGGRFTLTAKTSVWRRGSRGAVTVTSSAIPITVASRVDFSPPPDSGLWIPPGMTAQQASPNNTQPNALYCGGWKENDSWKLSVDLYSTDPKLTQQAAADRGAAAGAAKPEPVLISHYTMKVKVAGSEEAGEGEGYWQLDFIPDKQAWDRVREQGYRLLISKKDGVVRAVIGLRGYGNEDVQTSPDRSITFMPSLKPGYPLEILPFGRDEAKTTSPGGFEYSMTARAVDGRRVAQATASKAGEGDISIVRQTWAPGARWWSESEKQDLRWKMLLKARLIAEP